MPETSRLGSRLAPLVVLDLVNRITPCISGIIDDDMNLPSAELHRLLDKVSDACTLGDVPGDAKGRAPLRTIASAVLLALAVYKYEINWTRRNQLHRVRSVSHTGIQICDDNTASIPCQDRSCLSSYALGCTRDDSSLTCEQGLVSIN